MTDSRTRWEPEGEPRVTIIIPNYNGLKFMEPCFAALDKQTCRDFALLVVDNGSTDGSVEWLRENQVPSVRLMWRSWSGPWTGRRRFFPSAAR